MEQLPDKATGVMEMFSTSKSGIEVFSKQIIEAVTEGEVNPLKVRVWMKTVEEILEKVKEGTSPFQLTEADKYSEKTFEFAGATIEKAELGTKYNYMVCGDQEWEKFNVQVETWTKLRTEREAFLKALKKPLDIITEDGEAATIHPPSKTSTSGLKVSIRK